MQCCYNKDESAGGMVDVIFLSEHSMCLLIISVFTDTEIRRILKQNTDYFIEHGGSFLCFAIYPQ